MSKKQCNEKMNSNNNNSNYRPKPIFTKFEPEKLDLVQMSETLSNLVRIGEEIADKMEKENRLGRLDLIRPRVQGAWAWTPNREKSKKSKKYLLRSNSKTPPNSTSKTPSNSSDEERDEFANFDSSMQKVSRIINSLAKLDSV